MRIPAGSVASGRARGLAAALLLGAAVGAPARAQAPGDAAPAARAPGWRLWNGAALGANPWVLGDQTKVFRKWPLGRGDTFLTADAHWRAGVLATTSPTFVLPEVVVGFSPALVLDVELHWGPALNLVHYPFARYGEDYGPAAQAAMPWRTGWFTQGGATVNLRAGVGPFAVVHMLDLLWIDGPDYFFHWDFGTIVKRGLAERGKTLFLWQVRPAWRAGVAWYFLHWEPTGYTVHALSAAWYVEGLPGGMTGLAEAGWHVVNPDFQGPRAFLGMFREWDLGAR